MQIFHLTGAAPLYTNTFLVVGSDGHAAAIDPAAAPEEYEKLLMQHGAELTHIFLTHGHHDHVGAVRALREKYGAKVWLGAGDREGSRLFPLTDADCDATYTDGEVIALDEGAFRVIATPGHTQGGVCLVCGSAGENGVPAEEVLFSGDTLFAGEIGRCDLPGGSYPTMLKSLAHLRTAIKENPQVLPGHENFSEFETEKQHNPYLSKV